MLTYTQQRNLFRDLAGLSSNDTTQLTLADQLINSFTKQIFNAKSWWFLQRTKTDTTVASQNNYKLPVFYKKMINTKIRSGTTDYFPKEAPSRDYFDALTASNSAESTGPEWYYIYNGEVLYYPTPSTASLTITHRYEVQFKDLARADYTTGTIVSIANATTTVTGSGTTWTSAMAGRFIRITETDAAASGDHEWYEISSVTSNTILELVKKYNGTTLAAASATYAIGQISPFPDGYHELPVYKALQAYFATYKPDSTKYTLYKDLGNELMKQLVADQSNRTIGMVVDDGDDYEMLNPNLTISL